MKIMVLNCGSSSIKYQLLDMANEPDLLAKGLLDRIGIKDSELSHQAKGKEKYNIVKDIPDHTTGINLILEVMTHPEYGILKSIDEIKACGHRVAHGGIAFKDSALVTEQSKKDIEACFELAPLHNPANHKGIVAMEKILPGVPQVAVFDTSFHTTMPAYAYMYAVPYEYFTKYKVRRYGFHGTSHKFVAQKACNILGKDFNALKIITCHLGNGGSIAAIDHGKSVDTSMGFTPVEGLIMGTRAGDLDLGALLFLMDKENLDCQKANNLVNKQSGMHGVSGISMDMRDLHKAAAEGHERAKLALDMYAYRVKKYIGSYAAAMNGVDLVIFTGGIGENDHVTRKNVCENMQYLGIEFDQQKNDGVRGKDVVLTKDGSKTMVMTVTTNEELVIATDAKRIIFG
jgi:acetate kinase